MENLFAVIGIGAGAYCLYAYVMMSKKKEINQNILLPKGVDARKCKDRDGYIKAVSLPLLVLGIVLLLYGGMEVLNAYVFDIGSWLFLGIGVVFVVLIWFAMAVKKANRTYFGV